MAFFDDDDKIDYTPVLADAQNRPEGWGTYQGATDSIDVRRGVDPEKLKADIKGIYGDLYHESDFEGRLKNLSYDTASYTYEGALDAARQNLKDRLASQNAHGGDDEDDNVRMPRMGAFPYTPYPANFQSSLGAFPSDIMDKFTGTFTAPDPNSLLDNPVVKARLAARRQAIEASAAAQGTLLNPDTLDALADDASAELSSEYANVYDRARSEFMDAYNIFTGDRSRRAATYGAQTGLDLNINSQNYTIARNNQLDPFDMSLRLRESGRADRGLDLQERGLGESLTMGAFNRDRTTRMDDYSIYDDMTTDYYDRLNRGITAGGR